ncbi:unnamed protein product [Ectocarpus sp. 12 AP-2014]
MTSTGPPSPATRVPPERNVPARVSMEGSRRNIADDRGEGARSGDGDATNGASRNRGLRQDHPERGAASEDDDNDDSKVDSDGIRRGPLSSASDRPKGHATSDRKDEFPLISVPLDTWVGRFVRITTPRHNGTTGLVHRTGNGWVNLQTALGDVAKRAYDLVVIPEERANIGSMGGMLKADAARGKRYRGGPKGGAAVGSNSGSGDERKGGGPSRNRSSRSTARTAHSSSDSSGQDDDGDEHGNGRSTRRRRRAPMDDDSDFEDANQGDDDDDDGDDDHRYDGGANMRNVSRGGGRGFPGGGRGRTMAKSGAREKGDRYGGAEPVKSSGRMSITFTRQDGGGGAKQRGRGGEYDRMRERERGGRGEALKGGAGRDRDGMKGDSFLPIGRHKEKDSDVGGSRTKRRDVISHSAAGDSEDKLGAGGSYRERVDRSSNKLVAANKKDEEVIKSSWVHQMQKAKERPNLVHWRDELVAITKDSSEDFEDATLSVELMRVRCDVCYHEKSDGDKFCWNEKCWMSPVFSGYCRTGATDEAIAPTPVPQSAGYINTFGRETLIDPALTSALQAPVKWLETKRKRKLEAHEVFSEDPALYRWQCWASLSKNPNSKDPTFVEDPRFRAAGRGKSGADNGRNMSSSKPSPETGGDMIRHDEGDEMHVDESASGRGWA